MVEGDHGIATRVAIVIEGGVIDDRDIKLAVIVAIEKCDASAHLLNDVLFFGNVGAGNGDVEIGIRLSKVNRRRLRVRDCDQKK